MPPENRSYTPYGIFHGCRAHHHRRYEYGKDGVIILIASEYFQYPLKLLCSGTGSRVNRIIKSNIPFDDRFQPIDSLLGKFWQQQSVMRRSISSHYARATPVGHYDQPLASG